MKAKTPATYRELMGIAPAAVLAESGHGPATTEDAPHASAPGRDVKGRILKAPESGEVCPACKGTGKKG